MQTPLVLTTLGSLLIAGLAVEWLGRRLPVPRVTLLLAFGVVVGPEALDLLPAAAPERWFEPVTTLALVMVGFLVGERFSGRELRERGRTVLVLSVTNVLGAAGLTAAGLWLAGVDPPLAMLLGAVAGASAPAATYDVVAESGADGPFARTLLGVVGIDDAWGLLVFALAVATVGALLGEGGAAGAVVHAAAEIGGALALGAVLGTAAGWLTQRIQPGEPTLLEALGIVLLTAGLAGLLGASAILAAIAVGVVMVNTGPPRNRAFHEIEHLEWPVMVLFFVLAGASLEVAALPEVGAIGAGYVALRALGLFVGARVGSLACAAPASVRRWMGIALLPQAGVALGMALAVEQRFPGIGERLLPLVIGATVVFEIAGPPCTRLALRRAGEAS